ncbi:MAG: 16S rRNA (guanine(966)-N(2))-methyltransferase RsmD [Thermodesulfobacteriota bacterium]
MRIIRGTLKGRRLTAPKGYQTRPTSDRIKESIFDILGGEIEGRSVLDLYAGTGNLGIEALSRGAKKTVFVEKGTKALQLITKNLSRFGMAGWAEILPKDALRAIGILKQRGECFDLIFIDPPYERGLIQKTLMKLKSQKIYHEDSILIIQHNRREPLPERLSEWNLFRQRKIGDTLISFLSPCKPLPPKEE